MRFRRTKAIAVKEVLHILRDPRSLIAALGLPVLLLALFGYALSMDVDRISTAIYDEDQSSASQDLLHMFRGSRYFTVVDAQKLRGYRRTGTAGRDPSGSCDPHGLRD